MGAHTGPSKRALAGFYLAFDVYAGRPAAKRTAPPTMLPKNRTISTTCVTLANLIARKARKRKIAVTSSMMSLPLRIERRREQAADGPTPDTRAPESAEYG